VISDCGLRPCPSRALPFGPASSLVGSLGLLGSRLIVPLAYTSEEVEQLVSDGIVGLEGGLD